MKAVKYTFMLLAWGFATANAAVVWEVDFEDGFNASSPYMAGAPTVIGGSVSLVQDADAAYNYGVNVGTGGALYYYDLGTLPLSANGKVTLDFKVTQTVPVNSTCAFFSSFYGPYNTLHWAIGVNKLADGTEQALVRSSENLAGAGGDINYLETLGSPLSVGWHHMEFTWKSTAPRIATLPSQRERADIRLYIDGNLVVTRDDTAWTISGNRRACVGGCYGSSAFWQAGVAGILVDNVQILPYYEDPPAWDVTYWEATYDSNDLAATSGVLDWGGAVTLANDAVRVGTASGVHWLRYTGLRPPASALVSVDFTLTAPPGGGQPTLFQLQDQPVLQALYQWFGFYADGAQTIFIVRKSTELDGVEIQYIYKLPYGTLTVGGKHNMTLMYDRTAAGDGVTTEERADLKLWVDGQRIIHAPDASWAPPVASVFGVGSFYNGINSYNMSGAYLQIDNVVMKVPEEICGIPGTVYLDGDVNLDCRVDVEDMRLFAADWLSSMDFDLDDFAVIAGDWLGCTDPVTSNCP